MKPIYKFNNGRGATICTKCSVIISEGLTKELYCEKCKPKQERSYSEEDMRKCWMACLGFNKPEKFNSRVKFEQWFETFSK